MPDTVCIICHDSASEQPIPWAVVIPCGHAYHSECIEEWHRHENRGRKTCPTCRGQVQMVQRIFGTTTTANPASTNTDKPNVDEKEMLMTALRAVERRLETTQGELEMARMELEEFHEYPQANEFDNSDYHSDSGDEAYDNEVEFLAFGLRRPQQQNRRNRSRNVQSLQQLVILGELETAREQGREVSRQLTERSAELETCRQDLHHAHQVAEQYKNQLEQKIRELREVMTQNKLLRKQNRRLMNFDAVHQLEIKATSAQAREELQQIMHQNRMADAAAKLWAMGDRLQILTRELDESKRESERKLKQLESDLEQERKKSWACGDRVRKLQMANERLSARLAVLSNSSSSSQQQVVPQNRVPPTSTSTSTTSQRVSTTSISTSSNREVMVSPILKRKRPLIPNARLYLKNNAVFDGKGGRKVLKTSDRVHLE